MIEIVVPTLAYEDVGNVLAEGLAALGMPSRLTPRPSGADAVIVLGPHWLDESGWALLPGTAILYNLDPLGPHALTLSPQTVGSFARHRVWDYSCRNGAYWRRQGMTAVTRVPIGYAPSLRRASIVHAGEDGEDLDVLFYGSLSPRRVALIERMRNDGLQIVVRTALWGQERDRLVARAKVIVHCHYTDGPAVFEMARMAYLLANQKAVVAEVGPLTEIDDDMRPGVLGVPYPAIPAAARWLLSHQAERRALGRRAFSLIARRPESAILARVFGGTLPFPEAPLRSS
ncbi:MAG: hypothetical protein OWU84_07440 [Firmicutes bacterium]|nr:hypothetical protein [Bacillota bacterium]